VYGPQSDGEENYFLPLPGSEPVSLIIYPQYALQTKIEEVLTLYYLHSTHRVWWPLVFEHIPFIIRLTNIAQPTQKSFV
jgi:hypothetical protein